MSVQAALFGYEDGRVTEESVRARPAHVPLIVNLGGGWNSTAALAELRGRGIVPDLILFADTGDEKPGTYSHIAQAQEWCARVGFPGITTVSNADASQYASLEDNCLKMQTLPSRVFGGSSCAQKWKHAPMDKFLNHWEPAVRCWAAGDKPVKLIGYDGGELRRASILEDKKFRYWHPLIEWGWDREECRWAILRAGMELPPKSACFYCPSSTKDEVLWLARTHPDLFKRAVEMERNAAANCTEVKGLGRHWSWEALLAADPAVRAGWLEAPVEACLTCEDGGECPVQEAA